VLLRRKLDDPEEPKVYEALLPADAPEGHIAHSKARYNGTHANPLVGFRYDGVAFQTTVAAAGSRYAAEVIARACWMRFEQGETKEAILRFRNECYERVNTSGIAPKMKRSRTDSGDNTAEVKASALQRLSRLTPESEAAQLLSRALELKVVPAKSLVDAGSIAKEIELDSQPMESLEFLRPLSESLVR
jgi:hypothetical protein